MLGRKGGLKGGAARPAQLTPEQGSAGARRAVRARWEKAGKSFGDDVEALLPDDTSDTALAVLLTRLKVTTDLTEVKSLSEKIERVIFHKQFEHA